MSATPGGRLQNRNIRYYLQDSFVSAAGIEDEAEIESRMPLLPRNLSNRSAVALNVDDGAREVIPVKSDLAEAPGPPGQQQKHHLIGCKGGTSAVFLPMW